MMHFYEAQGDSRIAGDGMRIDDAWLNGQFVHSARHGISLPRPDLDWDELEPARRAAIWIEWETIRGAIPDRIAEFETMIRIRQDRMSGEEDFAECCRINEEIADLASRINDLNIWFRIQREPDEADKTHIG
ncbi:hypothetical protein ACF3MZ_03735 [Paenibacillaceae bacterium WGS1546]|uniref:hypothetical protein n=1 Tax=Cohnella sp. WGS1546 TaxID=3366810 RepID=UPI00372D4EEF